MAKKIFIAATRQNDGKTTLCLGLIAALRKKYPRVGFIKPVGQRYVEEDGIKVDEDSVLIDRVCDIKCRLKDMSPVAVEKGFTERYILKPRPERLIRQIKESFEAVARNKDLIVIEGTGHAGVGSVFDLSNAVVAKLLDARVVLVSAGGLGRPIDEIMLNKTLFEKEGVDIAGVIINKVHRQKFAKINKLVRMGLSRKGVNVLGVIPYCPILQRPTISQVLQETGAKLLHGRQFLHKPVGKVIIAAMEPHEALAYIENDSLVITPGDRVDIILSIIASCLLGKTRGGIEVCGIILSGGIVPERHVMKLIKKTNLPVLLLDKDTYSVAASIHDLTIKITPGDKDKTEMVVNMVKRFVDIEQIEKQL